MEPLLKQLRELPGKIKTAPAAVRVALITALVACAGLVLAVSVLSGGGDRWQYAFTNLSTEDAAEAAQTLKGAGIPFRAEAGGAALAVPAAQVYDARLLLAAQGLPRGGGVGFELFDRSDLGVSEFTQKINLRRATEGELARTVSRLASVRSARVHLTMTEKGLYRDDDRKASATVVVNLQPGRTLGERELQGVRHLVASAVAGLSPDAVTILDGRGAVLAAEAGPGKAAGSAQRELEHDLETRVVSLLEPVVGAGAVVARVSATMDAKEVSTQSEVFDPEATAVRSEHKLSQNTLSEQAAGGGVAGAAANVPLNAAPPAGASAGPRNTGTTQDETRNFEVSKTTTTTVARMPRLERISVAVLLDGVGGKPRPDAEVARLGELARRAVGFDAQRGDVLEISSAPFVHAEELKDAAAAAQPAWLEAVVKQPTLIGGAVLLLVLLLAVVVLALRGGGTRTGVTRVAPEPVLRPGARVAEIEATLAGAAQELGEVVVPKLNDPHAAMQARARELAKTDPTRAALLLRAWIQSDAEKAGG